MVSGLLMFCRFSTSELVLELKSHQRQVLMIVLNFSMLSSMGVRLMVVMLWQHFEYIYLQIHLMSNSVFIDNSLGSRHPPAFFALAFYLCM